MLTLTCLYNTIGLHKCLECAPSVTEVGLHVLVVIFKFMKRNYVSEYENDQSSLSKVAPTNTVGMPSINIPAVTKDDDIPSASNKSLDMSNEISTQSDKPVQKNKKRCWTCRVKLELAQRELGICKCGRWFLYTENNLSIIMVLLH